MNYLWLAHAVPYPPKAGFLLRSYNLLRELARRQRVDLIAFVQEPWMTTLFPSLEEGLAESRRALQEFCNTVTFLPIDSVTRAGGKPITAIKALLANRSYTASWLYSARANTEISRRMQSAQYDLIHFDTIGLAPYRRLLARSTASTLTHHNIESHMMLRRADNARNPLARAYFKHEGRLIAKLERQTARQFDAHITCSELDSERLTKLIPDLNPVAVPNGVDCEYFKSNGAQQRKNSLIFVGTMNWYPNIDAVAFFLKEVWPLVRKRVPSLTMDIAGSNPPESIVSLASTLEGVTVHGYVDDVRPMIDSAAIFVCPIRDGGGTKLKILDAFAMSKCVVAHPIACEGIDVTPDANVVFAETAEEFADRVEHLLQDEERRKAIGRNARSLVEAEYSFSAIGAHFADVLVDVVKKHRTKSST